MPTLFEIQAARAQGRPSQISMGNELAVVSSAPVTNMGRCEPCLFDDPTQVHFGGWLPFTQTCPMPYTNPTPRVCPDRALFDSGLDEPNEVVAAWPTDLVDALSGTSYFAMPLNNGLIIPSTGNVGLVQDSSRLPNPLPVKDFANPIITTWGAATGVDRRAQMTTLTGKAMAGPLSVYLNTAEIRGINPSATYSGTFDPSLNAILNATADPSASFPYAMPY